ncbi:Uncharacterised protein [Salmonella enterica subsp. enterica serovar Bovismorbificans]|uniref:Uncharacterized protein n=1 Tax=Salmonella enterica subsp. enterica serovar Bovismorbificans TaxID=58097 RepID=A0A655BN66_SALET|nr:Uncharacterised protein [Salmonella enterica subsp. enterica serovar Bovismorbificans]
MDMDLRQQLAFKIQPFGKRLKPNQHAAFAALHPFTVQLYQPVTRLVALDQEE